jgi:hypothetical protein
MDIRALVGVLMPHFAKSVPENLIGQITADIDTSALNAELARLPDGSDETLR